FNRSHCHSLRFTFASTAGSGDTFTYTLSRSTLAYCPMAIVVPEGFVDGPVAGAEAGALLGWVDGASLLNHTSTRGWSTIAPLASTEPSFTNSSARIPLSTEIRLDTSPDSPPNCFGPTTFQSIPSRLSTTVAWPFLVTST